MMRPFVPRHLLAPSLVLCVLSALAGSARAKPKARHPLPKGPAPTAATASPPAAPAAAIDGGGAEVTVVELAGTQAYVRPGAAAGIRRGATVTLHGKAYPVVEATDSFAVIDVGDDHVRELDKGRASLVAGDEHIAPELPKPRPLATWERAWQAQSAPADTQRPAFVPLGGEDRDRRYDVRLSAIAGGTFPLTSRQVGAGIASGELNARVHAEPLPAPLKLDIDASLRGWAAADLSGRVGGPTRSTLFVRELMAGYASGRWYAGVGRMRYAASTLGTLDGGRVQTQLGGGFAIGALGGVLPNPMSGAASLDAQRFGVEARYSRPDLALRPEAALVAHGSMFQGRLDERRLSGVFGIYPGQSRLGAYVEISSFDATNPWKQPAVALTAVGLDQSVRVGPFTFGARGDLRQPEMSRWLSTFFPASWFCRTVPAPGSAPIATEPCDGSISTRAFGELDASVEVDRVSFAIGATTVKELKQSNAPDTAGGFATARVVRIANALRLEASGNYSRATYLDMLGLSAGPGLTLLGDALDVSAYYRLSILKYRATDASLPQNGIGASVAFFPSSTLLLTLQGESITGDDVNVITLFATATWRPRL